MEDMKWMELAISEAEKALEEGEVPVGAVVVRDGILLGAGHNVRESRRTPMGHAEIIAMDRAARTLGDWKLKGCTLYVTLEPCVMCTGACIQARLSRIVFGAYDPKAGCCGSVTDLTALHLDSEPDIFGGLLEERCQQLLDTFFDALRTEKDGTRIPDKTD